MCSVCVYEMLEKSSKKFKKYFLDTVFLCYLLNIKDVNKIQLNKFIGTIFENFVFIFKVYNIFIETAPKRIF